jgi:hypothetical protein
MSIYSTLTIKQSDAIKLIAIEMGIELRGDENVNRLIEMILFDVTSRSPHSPYVLNNYDIVNDDYSGGSEMYDPFKEPDWLKD